jgi:hypothetical protein
MTTLDIVEEIRHLPPVERLAVLESALHELRAELIHGPTSDQLRQAAEALRQDYQTDTDLTAFTTLDAEPIHA